MNGILRIIPLGGLHEIGHDGVAAYSPSLANKLAAGTEDGITSVVESIVDVFGLPVGEPGSGSNVIS